MSGIHGCNEQIYDLMQQLFKKYNKLQTKIGRSTGTANTQCKV